MRSTMYAVLMFGASRNIPQCDVKWSIMHTYLPYGTSPPLCILTYHMELASWPVNDRLWNYIYASYDGSSSHVRTQPKVFLRAEVLPGVVSIMHTYLPYGNSHPLCILTYLPYGTSHPLCIPTYLLTYLTYHMGPCIVRCKQFYLLTILTYGVPLCHTYLLTYHT